MERPDHAPGRRTNLSLFLNPDKTMPSLDQSRTKSAYGLQWNRYRIIRTEEDRATFRSRTGLSRTDLENKVILDAGCGMGRYLRIAAESSTRLIVGLDLSQAVVAAHELTALPSRDRRRSGRPSPIAVRRGELRPDLLPGSARPHARPAPGVPRTGPALEAGRTHRHLGLSAQTRARGSDHERPAGHFDTPAGRFARLASGRRPSET